MKKIIGLIALLVCVPALAFAENDSDASGDDYGQLTEVSAERYENIDKKWEVELEFENDKEYTIYVYEVTDENDLLGKITDKVNDEFGTDFSESEIESVLEIDDEFNEEDEDEKKELEIETKPFQQIKNKWQVDIEYGDKDYRTYVYEVSDEDDLLEKITDAVNEKLGTSFSDSEIEDVLDIEEAEFDEEDEDEGEDDKKEEKTEDKKDKETVSISSKDKEAQIEELRALLQSLINQLITLLTLQISQ